MVKTKDISISKGSQGQLILSAIVNGYLVTNQYFYYSKREAIKDFKAINC